MQELLELVMLFREEANALGAVYAVLLEPGSKEHQLFDALLKGTVNAESEGIELLYGSAAGAQVN